MAIGSARTIYDPATYSTGWDTFTKIRDGVFRCERTGTDGRTYPIIMTLKPCFPHGNRKRFTIEFFLDPTKNSVSGTVGQGKFKLSLSCDLTIGLDVSTTSVPSWVKRMLSVVCANDDIVNALAVGSTE